MAFLIIRNRKKYEQRKFVNKDRCKELLRFEDESIEFITNYFLPEVQDRRGGALSARQKMEIFLRYLADPGFQSGVSLDFGVSRSTVSKTFSFVLDKINLKAHEWIHFPLTANEIEAEKRKWSTRFKMPCVIGAIDCTHLEIKKPKYYGDCYLNRKKYASINVQATCNSEEKVTSVDASWPGSTHDSRIWRRSEIKRVIMNHNGAASLLGDSGYAIAPWLVTPFLPPTNRNEIAFNTQHKKERVVIERVFGQLKKRFPILGNLIRINLEKVPKTFIACSVLHNIGKHLNDVIYDEETFDEDVDENDPVINDEENDREIRLRGQQKRNEIMNVLLTML